MASRKIFYIWMQRRKLETKLRGTQKDFYYTSKYNKMFLFFWSLPLTEAVLLAPPSMIWSRITTHVRQVAGLTRGGMMNSRTEERGEVWSAGGSSVLSISYSMSLLFLRTLVRRVTRMERRWGWRVARQGWARDRILKRRAGLVTWPGSTWLT